jgi:cytochrome c peroxidase
MKKTPFLLLALMAILALSLASGCQADDEPTPTTPDLMANEIVQQYLNIDLNAPPNYASPAYPTHYDANIRATDNAPSLNPVTDRGALLGRVIFYDRMMSLNNTVACASCHVQAKGFTDDKVLSLGFMGGETGQHSMRLANANFYAGETMFWNKRARDLEEQSTMPIKDHTEMGFDAAAGGIDSLIRKMKRLSYYPALFDYAFGSPDITEERMQRALAQFVRSMVSTGSKFDQGFAQVFNTALPGAGVGQAFPNFTAQENLGKQLFLLPPNQGGAACAGCHAPPTFALAANSLSNGLDAGETVIFKSPSLKNIAVVGPYMHDGRLANLQQVIDHYNNGIQAGPALDNRLRTPNGQPLRLNLSQEQKDALAAFLQTLTDNDLLTDPKFGDPFK